MALLFGFGLHDSIVNIGILQYEDLQLFDADLILNEEATDTAKQEITDNLKVMADQTYYTGFAATSNN